MLTLTGRSQGCSPGQFPWVLAGVGVTVHTWSSRGWQGRGPLSRLLPPGAAEEPVGRCSSLQENEIHRQKDLYLVAKEGRDSLF